MEEEASEGVARTFGGCPSETAEAGQAQVCQGCPGQALCRSGGQRPDSPGTSLDRVVPRWLGACVADASERSCASRRQTGASCRCA